MPSIHNQPNLVARRLGHILLVASLFCIAKFLQNHYLGLLSLGPRASLFYLPASVIVLASLITPLVSMFGIFLGSYVFQTFVDAQSDVIGILSNSLVPAIASALAVLITINLNSRFREFHESRDRFSRIDAIDIFYFCVLYATFNVCLSEVLNYFQNHGSLIIIPSQIFAMAFGDVTGSFLVFIFLNIGFSALMRFR